MRDGRFPGAEIRHVDGAAGRGRAFKSLHLDRPQPAGAGYPGTALRPVRTAARGLRDPLLSLRGRRRRPFAATAAPPLPCRKIGSPSACGIGNGGASLRGMRYATSSVEACGNLLNAEAKGSYKIIYSGTIP